MDQFEDERSLNLHATALADQNINIRSKVRENLIRKAADPTLTALVDDVIRQFIIGERWQGNEQAIIMAVTLGKSEFAGSFIALLDHPRPEVNIRAAWGLQMLDLEPESLEAIIRHCQLYTQRRADGNQVALEEEVRVAFCFEALGRHVYQPANEMLMLYVPKKSQQMGALTRTSAIYALGHLWAGRENRPLVDELARRMHDPSLTDPEAETVKYVCAIAIGRNGDASLLPEIDALREHPSSPLGMAAAWARQQLTVAN